MNDQASTLRLIASNNPQTVATVEAEKEKAPNPRPARVKPLRCLAITGGKGGVGKSNLSINLALELGKLLNRVILIDADFGLANADLLCGISPKFHLGHVVANVKEIEDIAISLDEQVKLIPSGSGIEELANISTRRRNEVFSKLATIEKDADYMLIDTAAGISENVIGVLLAAAEVIVVVTPEPTSIVDAYATIKTVIRHDPEKTISVVVNNVVGVGDAEQVFQQINSAVKSFLERNVEFLGMIPHDSRLVEAVREQLPVVQFAPDAPSSRAFRLLAKQLHHQIKKGSPYPIQTESFWHLLGQNNQ